MGRVFGAVLKLKRDVELVYLGRGSSNALFSWGGLGSFEEDDKVGDVS